MGGMDDNDPQPDARLEKAWAIAGLVIAAGLAWVSADLLISRKAKADDVQSPD
jgi:hypothetical protein